MTREELKSQIRTTINDEKLDNQLKTVMVMTLVDQFIVNHDNNLVNEIGKVFGRV